MTPLPSSSECNYVFCPAATEDYRIVPTVGEYGTTNDYGLVANRNIKKGASVFEDSLEFCFSDVRDGDWLLLAPNPEIEEEEEGNDDNDEQKEKTPICLPINRHVLLVTHGVPGLIPPDNSSTSSSSNSSVLKELWRLESPGMLMNHSCDPNVTPDSFDWLHGEGIATRDIAEGLPLTCDYALFYYDDGKTFVCHCGAKNCRGKRIGFGLLTPAEQERILPDASDVVQARHQHALGLGPDVVREDHPLPSRSSATPNDDNNNDQDHNNNETVVPRLVVPGPTCALAEIAIRPCLPSTTTLDDAFPYGLFATKDMPAGRLVYEFWSQEWPHFPTSQHHHNEADVIDMVFSLNLNDNDAPEGTVMRVDPRKCASRNAETGCYQFSGYDLLTHHSCHPNLVYRYKQEEAGDNWRKAYACRDIQKGDQLFVDFNSHLFDRTTDTNGNSTNSETKENDFQCHCGAANCRGIVKGFRHLVPTVQDELKSLSWLRQNIDDDDGSSAQKVGRALSPYIRKQLQLSASK